MKNIIQILLALLYSFQLIAQTSDSTKTKNYSASVNLGYTLHNAYAGRDFGVTQTSLGASLSYSHNIGIYSSIGASWVDNTYSSSSFGIGYKRSFWSWLSASAGYSKSFVRLDSLDDPLSNSFDGSIGISTKYISLGSTFSYLVGDETGRTISFDLSTDFSKDFDDFFISSVSFSPSVSTLLGTDNAVFRKLSINQYKKGSGKNIVRAVPKNTKSTTKKPNGATIATTTTGGGGGTTISETTITENPFGVLSYDFTLPISISIQNFGLSIAYNFSIPNQLSIYDGKLSNVSYFSFSASYSF